MGCCAQRLDTGRGAGFGYNKPDIDGPDLSGDVLSPGVLRQSAVQQGGPGFSTRGAAGHFCPLYFLTGSIRIEVERSFLGICCASRYRQQDHQEKGYNGSNRVEHVCNSSAVAVPSLASVTGCLRLSRDSRQDCARMTASRPKQRYTLARMQSSIQSKIGGPHD